MSGQRKRRVYGPVPSRRLGLSLGVDLVPYKVCCYDCLYCQLGPTTRLISSTEAFVDPDTVARDVEQALDRGRRPDVITLAGSGEPTLHRDLGQVVAAIRRVTDVPLCLLTNGGLLWRDSVARAAAGLDLVLPSLDAADPETFSRINRPAEGIDFERMLGGLRSFCHSYGGELRLEMMLVRGVNDSAASLRGLGQLARQLSVTSVDLNTVVRPPAYDGVRGLAPGELERALEQLGQVEARVVASPRRPPAEAPRATTALLRQQILDTLARRPCTVDDLSASLGADTQQVQALCAAAEAAGEVTVQPGGAAGAPYYVRRAPCAGRPDGA